MSKIASLSTVTTAFERWRNNRNSRQLLTQYIAITGRRISRP